MLYVDPTGNHVPVHKQHEVNFLFLWVALEMLDQRLMRHAVWKTQSHISHSVNWKESLGREFLKRSEWGRLKGRRMPSCDGRLVSRRRQPKFLDGLLRCFERNPRRSQR